MIRSFGSFGAVFGSVIMKKRKTSTSGEVTSTSQKSKPVIGPRCQRATISCPLSASTPIPAAKVTQNASAIQSSRRRDRMRNPPARITTSASTSHERHRAPPEVERVRPAAAEQQEAEDEADVRRVEDVLAPPPDHVLGEQRDGRRAGVDPPAPQAPPVAVVRSRHAQDERDAVARQQRARRPHQDVLACAARSPPRARRRSRARSGSGRSKAGSGSRPGRSPAAT